MTDIVERWREYRESMGSAMFGEVEPMAEEMVQEIERLREQAECADKVIEISRYMAIYGATPELWKQLDNALLDYAKEWDDD